jgi:hypothetical protein
VAFIVPHAFYVLSDKRFALRCRIWSKTAEKQSSVPQVGPYHMNQNPLYGSMTGDIRRYHNCAPFVLLFALKGRSLSDIDLNINSIRVSLTRN